MLTCQQLTEFVTDYLEGRMSFMERMGVQMHLAMCGRCRAYLRQMKMTVRTLGKLPAEAIPGDVRNELLARFRGMRSPGGAPPARVSWSVRLLAALERALGSRRGWIVVGLALLAPALLVYLSGASSGPVGDGRLCLATEFGAGLIPLVLVGLLATSSRSRVSPGVYAAVASFGALMGYVSLQLTCEMSRVAPHILVFHIGGIVLAGAMGLVASRLPALW
jgi:predicted anti-sigma-YlaC factor YlaD